MYKRQGIFGKSISELNLPQAAFIAGLPQSPSIYTPYRLNGKIKKDLDLAMRRKDIVLFRMYRNGDISKKDYLAAKKYDLRADFLAPEKASKQKKQSGYLYNLVMNKSTSPVSYTHLSKASVYSFSGSISFPLM